MSSLQVFTYKETPIRTVELDGGIWWVLADVCKVLNIAKSDSTARRLDDDEKGTHLMSTPSGTQNMTIINEPGLYSVILRSDKPEAKEFKRWITHEVLPSIRSKGSYAVAERRPMSPAQLLAAQAQVLVEIEQRQNSLEQQQNALAEKVENAVKVFSRPSADHWRDDMNKTVKMLCADIGQSMPNLCGKLYDELERRTGCSISARLSRLRNRQKKAGARYKDIQALTKLDAIAADKALRAVFEGVVREHMSIHNR